MWGDAGPGYGANSGGATPSAPTAPLLGDAADDIFLLAGDTDDYSPPFVLPPNSTLVISSGMLPRLASGVLWVCGQ